MIDIRKAELFDAYCYLRLPPSDLPRNKHKQFTPIEREPSNCLLSRGEYWRYSR